MTHENAGGNVKTGHLEGEKNTGTTKLESKPSSSSSSKRKSKKSFIESQAEASLTVYFDDNITTPFKEGQSYEDFLSTSPQESSSTTQTATSTRSTTLPTRNLSANAIYNWLAQTCNLIPVPTTPEDKARRDELAAFKAKAEQDREKVKKGMDEKRNHDAMLRRARGDAERMRGEA